MAVGSSHASVPSSVAGIRRTGAGRARQAPIKAQRSTGRRVALEAGTVDSRRALDAMADGLGWKTELSRATGEVAQGKRTKPPQLHDGAKTIMQCADALRS